MTTTVRDWLHTFDNIDSECPDGFTLHYIESQPKCLLSETESVRQIRKLFYLCGNHGSRLTVPSSQRAVNQILTALGLDSAFVGITEGVTEGSWLNLNDGSKVSSFGLGTSNTLDFGDWPENTAVNRTYICETRPFINQGNQYRFRATRTCF